MGGNWLPKICHLLLSHLFKANTSVTASSKFKNSLPQPSLPSLPFCLRRISPFISHQRSLLHSFDSSNMLGVRISEERIWRQQGFFTGGKCYSS